MSRRLRLKPLAEQVMVITGASSGIGLATAVMAAQAGATVVLIARSRQALDAIVQSIEAHGGSALAVEADVADAEAVERAGDEAVRLFGRIDTWVNNAGVSSYGTIEEIGLAEHRRIFETNYFGLVNGSLTAVRHMKRSGGAIINIGSVLSERVFPLQVPYAASKHAVKGFTNGLRSELQTQGHPISVTLVKPASVATPYMYHAGNHLHAEPTNPPPVYAPELVAETILHAAQHPVRDLYVGGFSWLATMLYRLAPGLSDRTSAGMAVRLQHSDEPAGRRPHSGLFQPTGGGHVRNEEGRYVRRFSTFSLAQRHPVAALAALALAGGVVAASMGAGRRRE